VALLVRYITAHEKLKAFGEDLNNKKHIHNFMFDFWLN
jgi:hypothetical protein